MNAPESREAVPTDAEQARPASTGTGLAGLWRRQPAGLRYLIVGGYNTVVGLILYTLCILVGMRADIALVVSNVLGIIHNFFTTGGLVFGNRDPRRIGRFLLAYAVMLGVNAALLDGLIYFAHLGPIVAQAICFAPVLCLNFVLQRRLVFGA